MLVALQRLEVPPGQKVRLHEVTWEEFNAILEELGEHRGCRVAYAHGVLEIMSPLAEHEYDREIIGDLVKALLEEQGREFCSLGSTTFTKPPTHGLEPDQCFYIQHEAAIRGKKRIDLASDPPPDLALEVDLTSRTHPATYAALGVPELWRFAQGELHIYVLHGHDYVEVSESPTFPALALRDVLPAHLAESKRAGRSVAMRHFRSWVQSQRHA
ncbi:MAG: Uma2 family endonuclease [Candidatus Tectomicrobia bacterium]|uniref:Uma2 family endonuclease n=1 Tax=Tectimicrobiota bacterium TaxID=2528274 RepID=A0A938B3N5_UNCTE|nr:Uma2 family endonuclease [Candidatus Tectomicrobia bacterium]